MIRSGMVQFHTDLEVLLKPIDSVQPHPENYNNGDVEALGESIEVSGMYRPIYAQASTGNIIAGNHTWMACKNLAADQIPVVMLDVDDITAKRIMVADNRIAELARPDNAALVQILNQLNTEDSLMGTGYKNYDLEVLEHLAEIPVEFDEFGQWPTITVQVPPHIRQAYYDMTIAAEGDDRGRFELLLRLAGWDGRK